MLKLNTLEIQFQYQVVFKTVQLETHTHTNPISLEFRIFASKDEPTNGIIPQELAGAGYIHLSERSLHRTADSPFPLTQDRSWRERPVLRRCPFSCLPLRVSSTLTSFQRNSPTSAQWLRRTHCSTFSLLTKLLLHHISV